MSQFNIGELASLGKQETGTQDYHKDTDNNSKATRLPLDMTITHKGEIIGTLETIEESQRCDCPHGHLHSDGLGEDYAHTVRLSGGEVGISCSGDSCTGLFIPDTQMHQSNSTNMNDSQLDVRQLDAYPLLHFGEEMIPKPIRRWTLDNCLQTEGSLNYGAVTAIIVCSNVIGMRCQVKPKRHSDWKLTSNLWGAVIGGPSQRKSPVVDLFLQPLKKLQKDTSKVHKEKMIQYESERIELSIAEKVKQKAIQKAYETADESMIADAKSMHVPRLEEPKMERFIVNDTSSEKTGEIMSVNERTILQCRDELSGFFAILKQKGKEGDRAFYLEAFKGDSTYTYDRIGRGTIHIEKLSIGLFGTIQPSELANIIPKNGNSGDGLAQRMQLAVFSDGISKPYYDEPIDKEAREKAFELVKNLAYESYEQMPGAQLDYDGVPYFTFDNSAQEKFVQWYEELKIKERNEPDNNMQAHIGKYYGLLPSLALTFFLVDKVSCVTDAEAIGLSHLEMAIEWCNVLETHARKMYALANTTSSSKSLEQKIVEYIQKTQDRLPLSFGQISQGIRGANANDIEEALKGIALIEGKKVIKLIAQ